MILTFHSKNNKYQVSSASKSFGKHFFAGAVLKIILYHRLKHIVDNSIWLDVYSMIVVFFSFFNSCVCCYGFVEAAPTSHHIQLIVKREQNEYHKPIVKQKQQTKNTSWAFLILDGKKKLLLFPTNELGLLVREIYSGDKLSEQTMERWI